MKRKTIDNTIELEFNNHLEQWRADKLKYGRYAQFESFAPIFLNQIVVELAELLHPEAARTKSDQEPQKFTLHLDITQCNGPIVERDSKFVGLIDDARKRLALEVANAYSLPQYVGVVGFCTNEIGHLI